MNDLSRGSLKLHRHEAKTHYTTLQQGAQQTSQSWGQPFINILIPEEIILHPNLPGRKAFCNKSGGFIEPPLSELAKNNNIDKINLLGAIPYRNHKNLGLQNSLKQGGLTLKGLSIIVSIIIIFIIIINNIIVVIDYYCYVHVSHL